MRTKALLIGLIIGLIVVAILGWRASQPIVLVSPLTTAPWFSFEQPSPRHTLRNFEVIGYLPYWNIAKVTLQPELTHLAYFSLTIDGNGQVVTTEAAGNKEPGLSRLSSDEWVTLENQAKAQHTAVEMTFTQMNNTDIEGLLNSPTAHQRFLESLDSSLLAYPVSGIHMDLEYVGTPSATLRANYVKFLESIKKHLAERYSDLPLRVDIYASAGEKYQIWDLAALEPHVDSVVVMAYDFHRPSSPVAGPVAPLFGGNEYWEGDITHYIQSILKVIPSQKVILGVPFYGYEWQTTTAEPLATTFPKTGGTASFERIYTLLNSATFPLQSGWNESALSPYVTYTEPRTGKHFVIFYDNGLSLRYKLELAKQLELGGIAIWALGYESSHRELWDVIGDFQKNE